MTRNHVHADLGQMGINMHFLDVGNSAHSMWLEKSKFIPAVYAYIA